MSTLPQPPKFQGKVSLHTVQEAVESVFQGCRVATPHTMGTSFHVETAFSDFELRVIVTGKSNFNLRFLQKKQGQKANNKWVIMELDTDNPDEFMQALHDIKATLLGMMVAIRRALEPRPQSAIVGISDFYDESEPE